MALPVQLVEGIGTLAGIMTTVAFVPQVLRTWRLGSARDFSLPMLLLFVGGVGLWLVYGLLKGALPLLLANAVTFVLAAFILVVKVRRG
jgi:MtN3 and saliva related transmembrane protein